MRCIRYRKTLDIGMHFLHGRAFSNQGPLHHNTCVRRMTSRKWFQIILFFSSYLLLPVFFFFVFNSNETIKQEVCELFVRSFSSLSLLSARVSKQTIAPSVGLQQRTSSCSTSTITGRQTFVDLHIWVVPPLFFCATQYNFILKKKKKYIFGLKKNK